MYRPIMPSLTLIVTHERMYHISLKYHLIKEDGIVLPSATAIINRPPSGRIVFYLYYLEDGLRVPLNISLARLLKPIKSVLSN